MTAHLEPKTKTEKTTSFPYARGCERTLTVLLRVAKERSMTPEAFQTFVEKVEAIFVRWHREKVMPTPFIDTAIAEALGS